MERKYVAVGFSRPTRFFAAWALAITASLVTSGCAGSLSGWLIDTRVAQGDTALANNSPTEAEKEYELALQLDPHNERARIGLTKALVLRANVLFLASKLDDAQALIARAVKETPDDPAAQALASQIEQARIRRDIVVANAPTYASSLASIRAGLKDLAATQKEIEKRLHGFSSDFDTAELVKAIEQSYLLEEDAHRTTLRLISYRGRVEGGQNLRTPTQGETPNLLPIP